MGDLREEIRTKVGDADAAGFDRFLDWLATSTQTEFDAFVDHNYSSPLDLVRSPATAARLLRLGGLGALGPGRRPLLHGRPAHPDSSASRPCMPASHRPRRAPSRGHHLHGHRAGVFYPEGGMHAVPRAMAQALTDAGVPIHLGVEVREVLRRSDGAVAGVRPADGERLAADAVVCTVDLPVAYDRLLPGVRAPRAVRAGDFSPSAVVWHVGASGRPGRAPAPPQHPLRRRLGRRVRRDHRPRRA